MTNRGVSMISIPGAPGSRWWLANSMSACDTAGMSVLSRPLRRWPPLRVAAAVIGLAWLALIAAFAYAASSVTPDTGSIVSAVAAAAIAGVGFLYAWRDSGR